MKQSFSSIQRPVILDEMSTMNLDVLVVGGGITGAGIALDAQTRGMTSGLIEMRDFASGTSSKSTKLVHGGLRYLKQFEIKEVSEIGKERAIVYENAPHVTTPLWMLLPTVKGGTFNRVTLKAGLSVYDRLAKVKRSERHSILNKKQTYEKEPLLDKKKIHGGGYYVEYRTDDARLTLEVMKEAVKRGTRAVNYVKAEAFLYENGKVAGVRAVDMISGKTWDIRAKKVINAAGPWVDTLREKDRSNKGKHLHLTKGVHITIDGNRFPLGQAVYFDAPDGRLLFAIPREGKVYIGTTDTDYYGDILNLQMTVKDRDYLLEATNNLFTSAKLEAKDVESSWAGVRPLVHEEGKDPSEISRKDEIFVSDSGLISIAGGKLTGYRKMAQRVIDQTAKELKEEGVGSYPKCQTRNIRLSGGDVGGSDAFDEFIQDKVREGTTLGLLADEAERLVRRYGSNVERIYDILRTNGEEAIHYNLTKEIFAMVVYGIEEEMTVTPADFFIRRSGSMFFHINWVKKWKDTVVDCMAHRLHWTDEEKRKHVEKLEQRMEEATIPAQEEK
ncbi:MAG TPA: glycerol-3-phosphate dehydrogenase/oxidase [Virgibacillus sp.]|nr:glycerol-3-phosphate dehydrogenase/oxidase [Virgibacillus sp.]